MTKNRYYDITDEPVTFHGYRIEETFQRTFKDKRYPDVLFLGTPPKEEN